VHFGSGKWLDLLKESKSQMVRRCYVDHDTVLRPTGQIEVDVRISRKGMKSLDTKVFWNLKLSRSYLGFIPAEVFCLRSFQI